MPNEVHTTSVCRYRSGWWACPTRASGWVPLGRVCMSHPSEWADTPLRSAIYPPLGVQYTLRSGCNVPSARGAMVHPARGAVIHPARGAVVHPARGAVVHPARGAVVHLARIRGTASFGAEVMSRSVQRYCLVRGRGTVPLGAGVMPRSGQR